MHLHGNAPASYGQFEHCQHSERAYVHHAAVVSLPEGVRGRRVRVVLGMAGLGRQAIGSPGPRSGVSLADSLVRSGPSSGAFLLSAVSYGALEGALPRARNPTFDTSARVERFVLAASSTAGLGEGTGGKVRRNT